MAGRFTVEAVFKAVDRVTRPITRMQNRVGKFTRSMNRGFHRLNRTVDKFRTGIGTALRSASVGVIALGAAMFNVISTAATFQRALGSAAVKFPEQIKRGTAAFKALEQAARDVGATTEFTATEAANALKFLAKAGFTAEFSMRALPGIVDFATAAELDLATAADIASDAIGQFGLASKDAEKQTRGLTRIMDVMAMTAQSTNTSVEELFDSYRDSAPLATAAGMSIEKLSAIVGVLASNGIKGTKSGTALKNIILSLAGVGNKASDTFKKLGINLSVDGKLRDAMDVFEELQGRLKSLGEEERFEITKAIFGKIPIASALTILSDTSGKIRNLEKSLNDSTGSVRRNAAAIRGDLKGSMDSLSSAIEAVKLSAESMTEGAMKDAIDRTTDWVRANEQLIASKIGEFMGTIANNLENIVTWIKNIGTGLVVFFVFNAVLKTLVGVMTLVNFVMAANPIGVTVLAIAALIAAVIALVVYFDDVVAVMKNVWGGLTDFYAGLWLSIVSGFEWLVEKAQAFGAGLKAVFSFAFDSLPDIVKTALGLLTIPFQRLINVAGFIMMAWEPVSNFFIDLWDGIVSYVEVKISKMMELIDKVKAAASFISNFVGGAIDAGVNLVKTTVSPAVDVFNKAYDNSIVNNTPAVNSPVLSLASNNLSPIITPGADSPTALRPPLQIVSPQEKIANSITENTTNSNAEVLIRTEDGITAEKTKGGLEDNIKIDNTGSF